VFHYHQGSDNETPVHFALRVSSLQEEMQGMKEYSEDVTAMFQAMDSNQCNTKTVSKCFLTSCLFRVV
jgi:hypothetical protein